MRGLFARFSAIGIIAAAAVVWTATTGASEKRVSDVFRLEPGDRLVVAGAPLGCRVKRMRQLEGRIVVDCRRGGALQGTYGTLLTAREAVLLRFESKRTARRVTTGIHRGKVESCR